VRLPGARGDNAAVSSLPGLQVSYDEVPYEGGAVASSHPAVLAAVAQLFGLSPAPPDGCRVLELGCGRGGNLIPMASALPEATFVGFDLSVGQVAEAERRALVAGLANVRFEQRDIRDAGGAGAFDYIICHGVYSWVGPEVQRAILATVRASLAPGGIAMVSYNTYPGWHSREVVRNLMLFHGRYFGGMDERAEQARAILEFAASATGELAAQAAHLRPYHEMFEAEKAELGRRPDYYVLHEFLEEDNHPRYLYQFVDEVEQHGLQYLGDANFASMLSRGLPAGVAETLDRVAPDGVALEQYRDFLVSRSFRQSLLCGPEAKIDRDVPAARLTGLFASLPVPPGPPPWDEASAEAAGGGRFALGTGDARAVMQALRAAYPAAASMEELGLASGVPVERVQGVLLTLLAHGAVDIRASRPIVAAGVGERPRATVAARLFAEMGLASPNLFHETVQFDPIARGFLRFVDGTRTVAELCESARAVLRAVAPTLSTVDGPITADELSDEDIRDVVDEMLRSFLDYRVLEA